MFEVQYTSYYISDNGVKRLRNNGAIVSRHRNAARTISSAEAGSYRDTLAIVHNGNLLCFAMHGEVVSWHSEIGAWGPLSDQCKMLLINADGLSHAEIARRIGATRFGGRDDGQPSSNYWRWIKGEAQPSARYRKAIDELYAEVVGREKDGGQ